MTRSLRASPPAETPPAPAGAGPEGVGTYEEALSELERLVSAMESGHMPLDSLLEGYRRAATLLAFCRERLQAVEDQVRVLEEGQLKPWSDDMSGSAGR